MTHVFKTNTPSITAQVANDEILSKKLCAELGPIFGAACNDVLTRMKGIEVRSIEFVIAPATVASVLAKYEISELGIRLKWTGLNWKVLWCYNKLPIEPKAHFLPDGKPITTLTMLRAAIAQNTSTPDINDLETLYWEELQKEKEKTKHDKVISGKVTILAKGAPNPVNPPVHLNRFMGMMPSSEIEKQATWSDGSGLKCHIDAGPRGWTITFADASTKYRDVAAGTEANYAEASKTLLSIFPNAHVIKLHKKSK